MEEQIKDIRILSLYSRLVDGQVLTKNEEAQRFNVTPKTIQRDIDDLRAFFTSEHAGRNVIYDRKLGGYRMEANEGKLSNSEILAVCKILLESRSLIRTEMMPILDKLIDCCVPEHNKKTVMELISNERFHYIEPHHGRSFLDILWELGQAVKNQNVISIEYEKLKDHVLVKRELEPVGILFSEYYFYLVAFIRNIDKSKRFENAEDIYPTIYRLDRIQKFEVFNEHFQVPYRDRFQEGEFRKRVQFMYGGRLEKIRFKYTGLSLESVLDRLPTARVISEIPNGWLMEAEVFGKGIEMWLRSQGDSITMLSEISSHK